MLGVGLHIRISAPRYPEMRAKQRRDSNHDIARLGQSTRGFTHFIKETKPRLAITQRSFGFSRHSHIVENKDDALHFTIFTQDRCCAVIDRNLPAIPRFQDCVFGELDHGFFLQDAGDWVCRGSAGLSIENREDLFQRSTLSEFVRPAGECFCDGIEENYPAAGICRDHRIANGTQGDAQLRGTPLRRGKPGVVGPTQGIEQPAQPENHQRPDDQREHGRRGKYGLPPIQKRATQEQRRERRGWQGESENNAHREASEDGSDAMRPLRRVCARWFCGKRRRQHRPGR